MKKFKQIPQIKYSNIKSFISYVADLEGDQKAFKLLENVGRKVMTEQEYVLIGFNHIVANAKNNKFDLTSFNKRLRLKKK